VPFEPNRVISKLNICLRTPTLPPSQGSESSRNFTPKTPQTLKQLRQQASSIKALLCTGSQSPLSPSNRALDQLVKGCQLAIASATILAQENRDLRAENDKKKQKRSRSRRQIQSDEGFVVTEIQERREAPIEVPIAPAPPQLRQPSPPLQPRTRALPKCSWCGEIGHRITTCQNRPK
jgi:hypothetical protein